MPSGTKISKYIELSELPSFLRDLADAIEQGGNTEFDCVDDLAKFKIKGSNDFGKLKLKASFKTNAECKGTEAIINEDGSVVPTKPKYKDLKKRMRASFNLLLKMIHDNEMPPDEAVQSFLDDSALMVTYPGYGDEYYDEYIKVCDTFRAAYEAKDLARMHEAIDALVHEKSRCHAKYD